MAEDLLHFGAVRLRINGTGSLQMSLITLDDAIVKTIAPLTMSQTPGREPTVLTNLITERARLKGITTEIDEVFRINRIILYVKPTYTSYPQ